MITSKSLSEEKSTLPQELVLQRGLKLLHALTLSTMILAVRLASHVTLSSLTVPLAVRLPASSASSTSIGILMPRTQSLETSLACANSMPVQLAFAEQVYYNYLNYFQDSARKICVKSTLQNCLQCQTDFTSVQNCTLCNSTYLPTVTSGNQETCKALNQEMSITYYVKGGAPMLLADYSYNPSQTGIGVSPGKPFLFLQEAINALHLYQRSNYFSKVEATIYLFGAQEHFFFQCDGDESTFDNTAYSMFVDYCNKINLQKSLVLSDNVHFKVQPLYCSLAKDLSMTKNSDFLSNCYSDQTFKPTLHVNHRNSYFNISGEATFSNIIFTGVNAFAVPQTIQEDYSILPLKFCEVSATPTPGDNLIALRKVVATTSTYSQLSFTCRDSWYPSKSLIPSNQTTQLRCLRNNYETFFPRQESTLACTNDIGTSEDFFWADKDSPVYSKRRQTLFNLYAFADHLTTWQKPPTLSLLDCEFSYFLGGYTNLINIEHNSLVKITKVNTVTLLGAQTTQNMDFFTNWQGQRGARIWIEGSRFSHSRFCLGLITYRKQHPISQYKAFMNFTDHIKNYTNYTDTGSYIILKNSRFTNLNYLTNVTALAIYEGTTPSRTFTGTNSLESIAFKATIHKGIVLNLEDFNGTVQIEDCQFTYNMHFIPEILITPYARTLQKDMSAFRDSYYTDEYKMTICDNDVRRDMYLFHHGISREDSFNNYFDRFERLGLIYISRPTQPIIITGSLFQNNMGTFGGAITVNSPVWINIARTNYTPYLYINNTQFLQNLGYFSGNAVYLRSTFLPANQQYICGAARVSHTLFHQNIGMKNHNGGGMGVVCYYLSSTKHDDYLHTSSITSPKSIADVNHTATSIIQSACDPSVNYTLLAFQVHIHRCNFTENYSGQRGTGLYISIVSKMSVTNSIFQRNGPVYGYTELYTSPYSLVFSKRPLSFYDPSDSGCYEEFNYINSCANVDSQIDWSSVRGALHVAGCQETWCLNINNTQVLRVSNTQFINNQAGPYLDQTLRNDLASSVYIYGGFQNNITNCTFINHTSSELWFIKDLAPKIYRYFPSLYFEYSQAPVIRIRVVPKSFTSTRVLNFSTVCSNCSFVGNKHIQILGLNYEKQYYGSLVNMDTDYNNGSAYAPSLALSGCTIKDNQFKGNQTSLFYLFKGLLYVTNTLGYGNGFLTKQVTSVQTLLGGSAGGYFPFDSYKYQQVQMLGMFHLAGMEYFPTGFHHQFINNTFAFNFAYQGSVYNLNVDNQYALFKGNRYSYNYADYMGPVIYARNQDARSTFIFTDEYAEYNFAETFGAYGLTPHDADFLSAFFYNSTFRNNKATDGSSLYLDSLAAMTAVNLTFYEDNWQANTTAYVISQFKQGQIKFYDFIDRDYMLYLTDQMPRLSGQVFLKKQDNSQDAYFLGTLMKAASSPYSAYAEFFDCRFFNLTATYGAAMYIQEEQSARVVVTKYDERTVIRNNTVTEYGAFFVTLAYDFIGENLSFKDNKALVRGSAIGVESAQAELRNCTFLRNNARSKGTIYISEDTNFLCDQCLFQDNRASEASAIFVINVDDANVTIANSVFRGNSHDQDLINFILSKGSISNSLFVDNLANKVNHGITLINSLLTVSNITVNYTDPNFLWSNNYLVDSGFFSLNFKSSLLVQDNSLFENCRGAIGSVIYATGFSSVSLQRSTIKNCASEQGGSLYFTMTNLISIAEVQFQNNSLNDIKLDNAGANISRSIFTKGHQSFINAREADLIVTHSIFQDGSNIDTSGKGIYCSCQNLTIVNTTFRNLNALEGGALYLTSTYSKSVFSIRNSTFMDNSAQQGGAIKVQDAASLTFTSNLFLRNKAQALAVQTALSSKLIQKGLGGAIFQDCYNINAQLANNCNITFIGNNTFDSNSATDDGGAILWVGNRFTYSETTSRFVNNSAKYGANIGSFAKSLVIQFVSNNDPLQPISNTTQYYKAAQLQSQSSTQQSQNLTVRRLLQQLRAKGNTKDLYKFELESKPKASAQARSGMKSYHQRELLSNNIVQFEGIVSGRAFSFVIYILDQDDNIYTSDSQSIAVLRSLTEGVVLQNFEVNAQSGVYTFNQVIINLEPGQQAQLELNIQDLRTYANDIEFLLQPIQFMIKTRKCLQGEAYTIDKSCIPCDEGSYLYSSPQSEASCNICDPNALCFGLNKVAPKPGYWRSTNISTNFVQCQNFYACLGGDPSHPTGNCSEGYEDVICGNCKIGYKKTSDFKCGVCPSKAANAAQFAGLIMVGVVICAFLVRSNINSASREKPLYTVYMKIMTNHFQMVAAISAIDYHWPNQIEELQSGQSSVSSSTDEIFSFDCFLQQNDANANNSDKVYTQKLILFTLLPLILAIASMAVWMLAKVIKGRIRKLRDKIISTMVVLLFLVHPTIAKILFQAFNCIDIDGVNRLKSNISMVCYQGTHLVYILVVVIPGILIWVIGIPLAALVMLLRNKQRIMKLSTSDQLTQVEKSQIVHLKMKYGFLFNGYSLGTFFWEVIILYRKILIIMVTVFFSVVSTEVQVLVVILIVITALFLQIRFRPYYSEVLNQMELYSLQVAVVTMYGGMFFITGAHYSYMNSNFLRWFFFLFILMPNVMFFVYWLHHMRLEILKMLYVRNARIFRLLSCNMYKGDSFQQRYMSNSSQDNKNRWSIKLIHKDRLAELGDGGVGLHQKEDKNFKLEGQDKTDFSRLDLITPGRSLDDIDQSQLPQVSHMSDMDLLKHKYQTTQEKNRVPKHRPDGRRQDSIVNDVFDSDQELSARKRPTKLQEIKLDFPSHMMRKIPEPETYRRGDEYNSFAFDISNGREGEETPASYEQDSFVQPQSRAVPAHDTQKREKEKQKFKLNFPTNMFNGLTSARGGGDKSSRRVMPESMANKLTARITNRQHPRAGAKVANEEQMIPEKENSQFRQLVHRSKQRDDVEIMSAKDDYFSNRHIDSAQKILNPSDINLEEGYEGLRSEVGDMISPFHTHLNKEHKARNSRLADSRPRDKQKSNRGCQEDQDRSMDSEMILPSIVEQQQNMSDMMSVAVGMPFGAEDTKLPQYDLFGNPVFPFARAEHVQNDNPFLKEREPRNYQKSKSRSKSPKVGGRGPSLPKVSNPFMVPQDVANDDSPDAEFYSSQKKSKSKQRGFMFHQLEEENKAGKQANQLSSGGPNSRANGQIGPQGQIDQAQRNGPENTPKRNRKKNRSRRRR